MNSTRPDVVFDCNVFLQAFARRSGPAAAALRLVERNAITLHISKPIIRELRRILADAEIRVRNPEVTDDSVQIFLQAISFRGVMHRGVPHVFDYPRDRGDEPYIDLAAAVKADFLVTRDNDLLVLGHDHSIIGKEFRQRFPFLQVIDPVSFLGVVKSP